MATDRDLLEKIKRSINKHPNDIRAYEDCFQMTRLIGDADGVRSVANDIRQLRFATSLKVREFAKTKPEDSIALYELLKKTYLYLAKEYFDDYLIYLEWNRKAKDKFYQPRRKTLYKLVLAIQGLADGELDELFLSMPPRVGKTTMLMFLGTWLLGRDSEKSNLYCAYSDTICAAFYNGILEVLQDPDTYLWHDVFPESKIVSTNAKEETLNIDRKKRYHSLTCRSLYGTLNGATDSDGFLISDDLISGIEEALNKDRLISAWSKVDNNLIPRAKEGAKILWCGTRWSMYDPAGLRMELLASDPNFRGHRYEIINVPALNSKEESNFDYDYGVGFSSEYYKMRRASFEHNNDMASWEAQYMGAPIERTGVLFEPSDMRYYNGTLPSEGLVRIFMAVDPAFGGGDFTSAPVCYQYEDGSIFVHDVVFNNGDKKITQPLLVDCIKRNGVQTVQFETTRTTASYKEAVEEMLKESGVKVNITSRAAPTTQAKEARIYDKSSEIREFFFRESGHRHKEYEQFMNNMFAFKLVGKNKHDDSVDSLAMCVDVIDNVGANTIKVSRRVW